MCCGKFHSETVSNGRPNTSLSDAMPSKWKKKQSRSNQLDDCGKFVKLLSRLIVCLLNQNSIDVQIFLFKETAQQGVSAESEFEQQSESIRTHRKLICPLENCSHSVFPLQSLAKCSRW